MAEEDKPWYNEFGAEFWMALSASVFAFFGVALRACLKSRCTNIQCCSAKGLVACEREPLADINSDPLAEENEEGTNRLKKSKTFSDLSAAEMGMSFQTPLHSEDEGKEPSNTTQGKP